jgi:hypothetical protein
MRYVRMIVLLVTLLVRIGLAAETPEELAQEYNRQGMWAYWRFDWKTAEELFRKALKEVPDHKLANYNLACVLSLRLSQDRFSWLREIRPGQDPWDQLARAIEVDPEAARKAAHDPDFANIRLTPRFQMLIGADLKDTRLIELLLIVQGEWFGGPCGAWCGNNLIFFENGEVTKKILHDDGTGHGMFEYEHGRYSIRDGVINIRYDSGQVAEGGFVTEGHLVGTLRLSGENGYFVAPTGDI